MTLRARIIAALAAAAMTLGIAASAQPASADIYDSWCWTAMCN